MYQALYRKWRPRTFDEVVGQGHITETLKRQAAAGRLSHAYLFTGTRGTGKTTCAKILARAANCENLQDGNPCNACPACLGIENGSILDVLELDAASNNGVDQVRALRDEAIYTPAAVRRRVYIIDEVHMLTVPAFNALLKILEEPPEHLMFILATTENHKVLATIKSRCQQFAFKRISSVQIAGRLEYVAGQEGISLTSQAAALLAQLADGGLRDALSLLDQCSGAGGTVDERAVLDTLGLAGNLETARLMGCIAGNDASDALETLGRLYAGGKEVGAVLGELSTLTRDLLLRKTAPGSGAALLAGGYDEAAMRALGERLSAQRLTHILTRLQETAGQLSRSANRRTDVELCLLRLCLPELDDSAVGLSARIAGLEERLAAGAPPPGDTQPPEPEEERPPAAARDETPPWEELPPPPDDPPDAPAPDLPSAAEELGHTALSAADKEMEARDFWPAFAASLRGKIAPSLMPYFNNPAKVTGTWRPGVLTLWLDSAFTRTMLNKPAVVDRLVQAAQARFGAPARVEWKLGAPPVDLGADTPPAPDGGDALDALLTFGEQYDNITIQ